MAGPRAPSLCPIARPNPKNDENARHWRDRFPGRAVRGMWTECRIDRVVYPEVAKVVAECTGRRFCT